MRTTRTLLGAIALSTSLLLAPLAQAESWQCVPFARAISGIQIFGDAHTWWSQASGKYQTSAAPQVGSVLAFKAQGRMSRGHVAVVSEVLTERIIKVTHANWSEIDGRRGQVEENVTVADVSDAGDWTKVRVWYAPIDDLGTTVYGTYGFIHQDNEALQLAARPASETPVEVSLALAPAGDPDPIGSLLHSVALLGN